MNIGSRQIITTFALVLAASACATTEETGELGTTESALGIPPTGGSSNKFHWNAYEKKPYIYKGCPDPGPDPAWAEKATLLPRAGTRVLEVELGTAVPLNVRVLSLSRGLRFTPKENGATIAVDSPSLGGLAFTLLVTSGDCSYELDAEIEYQ